LSRLGLRRRIRQMMRHLIIKTFRKSVDQVRESFREMPLELWNEAVFRFIYSQTLKGLEGGVKQFAECHRIDLVVHHKSERAVLEFKFYGRPARHDLEGKKRGFKGGPSSKNCGEFKKSVEKLRGCAASNALKTVALFYSDPVSSTGRKRMTFESCYGKGSDVEGRLRIRQLVSIGWFLFDGSPCRAKMFEVLP
jgi:hypothetical protein